MLDNIPMRVFWKDTESRFLGANATFMQDLNVSGPDELLGKSDYDFTLDSEETAAFRRDDKEVMQSGIAKLGIEESQSIPNGKHRWLRTNKVPFTDNFGNIIGLVGTYEDISAEVEYRQTIEHQALIDPLTNLNNRRSLQNKINCFDGAFAGLMFVDLDYFKAVNDSLGHLVGDQLLQQVADFLHRLVPEDAGMVCRLGGDEFGVFYELQNEAEFHVIMASVAAQIIDMLSKPFEIDGNLIGIGASVGITLMSERHGCDSTGYTEAFRKADMAMYAAKEKGRGCYEFYNDEMHAENERKNLIRKELIKGIHNDEFHLVFQPQYNLHNELIGAEALIRWSSEALGFVSPLEFIPIAEETGLIHSLGNWVFEAATSELAIWQAKESLNPNFKLAINVSSKQLRNASIANYLSALVEDKNLSPSSVQLEITESLLIDQRDKAVKTMLNLQRRGFSIAIDDFGTGYSSLSYIANLPIDKLKIDRSFVTSLDSNRTNKKLVDTIINMSRNLHMEVVAEGVESESEKATLIELGCKEFQGYLFSKPVRSELFLALFNKDI